MRVTSPGPFVKKFLAPENREELLEGLRALGTHSPEGVWRPLSAEELEQYRWQ
jgi:hypothetical protein